MFKLRKRWMVYFSLPAGLILFCILFSSPSFAGVNDTVFHTACVEQRQFTWADIEKASLGDWLKKPLNSEEFQNGKPPKFDDRMKARIWSVITTPEMGPIGGGVTLVNLSGAGLSGLDSGLTHLGGILTVVTLYNDIQNNNPAMQINFAKGATFWSIGTFSAFGTALKTAAVGISLFDYTLNKLGTVTSSMRYEFWEKAYAKYYDEKFGYRISMRYDADLGRKVLGRDDTKKWIKLIFEDYGGDVDRAMKEGFSGFWKDPLGSAMSVGLYPSKVVQNILEPDQEAIRKNYLRHVLPSVRKALVWKKERTQRDIVIEFQLAADKIYDELHRELIFFGSVLDKEGWPVEGVKVQLFDEEPVYTTLSGKYKIRIKACDLYDEFQLAGHNQAEFIAEIDDPFHELDYSELKRVDIAYVAGTPLREQGPHDIVMQMRELKTLEVVPDKIEIKEGTSAEIRVEAALDDGTRPDITDKVTWEIADKSIVHAEKGKVSGLKPGQTEIKAVFTREEVPEFSAPCIVKVLPVKELLKIELSPPSLKMEPGGTADVKAHAVYSDGTREDITAHKDCQWVVSGQSINPVKDGHIEAKKARADKPNHEVTVTFTFGKETKSKVLPVRIEYSKKYSSLKLSKTDVLMGLNKNVGLTAKVIISQGPFTTPVDVTTQLVWQASDPNIIIQTAGGVIVSGSREGDCTVTATLKLKGGKSLTALCHVKVRDMSAPLPTVDFTVTPKDFSHAIGTELTFTEKLGLKDLKNYDLIWYIGSVEKTGPSVKHTFTESGNFTVRLVVRSKISGKEDALPKTVRIEAPPDADCALSVSPAAPYTPPAPITFSANCIDVAGQISAYRWYIDGKWQAGQKKPVFSHTFTEPGRHLVKLGVRLGSNFDEIIRTTVIAIGEQQVSTPLGRLINRFEDNGAPGDLRISGSYWIGGDGEWSAFSEFDKIGPVAGHVLCTGDAEGAYNTGFLVYAPNQDTLKFSVYGYNFNRLKGRTVYSGTLDLHGKKIDAVTLRNVRCDPRSATFEWRCTDGSLCKVEIYKIPAGGFITGGVKDGGCIEGNKSTTRGTLKSALEAAARQRRINPGDVLGPQLEGLEEAAKELDFGTPDCMFSIRGNLPSANGGSVEVNVFDDTAIALDGLLKWKKYFLNLGSKYKTEVKPASFHGLKAFTWMLYYSDKTDKEARRMSKSSKGSQDILKDWIGYKHYGMSWIQDNVWVSLYTKQNSSAGRSAANALAEAVYTELAAISTGRLYCEGEGLIIKEFSYLNTIWSTRLQAGRLEVRGANGSSGKWNEKKWITVSTDVSDYSGEGTSKGPVVVYKAGGKWHIVMLDWASGARKNPRRFSDPITIRSAGKYGVTIQVGEKCYDYSWSKLKKINCKSARYE